MQEPADRYLLTVRALDGPFGIGQATSAVDGEQPAWNGDNEVCPDPRRDALPGRWQQPTVIRHRLVGTVLISLEQPDVRAGLLNDGVLHVKAAA